MKSLAERNTKGKKPSKDAAKKKEGAERRHLRAVEEQQNDADGGGDEGDSDPVTRDDDHDNNNSIDDDHMLSTRRIFTQEHIARMFDGELDEFASLTNHELHSTTSNFTQKKQPSRIQYVVENEISGDFFRVRGNRQQRKPWGFASTGLSFSKLETESSTDHDRSFWSQLGSSGGALRDLETALVIMCQGILAGLCWMDALNLSSSDGATVLRRETKDMFACAYSAVADRSRQLFFILFKYPL